MLRDKVIPVVDLARDFTGEPEAGENKYVVICNIGEKTIGIKARAVEGQEEVVIKTLGEFLGSVKRHRGGDIRGDGKAILILDMSALVSHTSFQNAYRKIA